MEIKNCSCGKNLWERQVDEDLKSWIRCSSCGDNMFDPGVGVILINWDLTDIDEINIEDVLIANKQKRAV